MLVKREGKILLIERRIPPFGFAPPAGHVDDGEEFEDAAQRELEEEVGLKVKEIRLLAEKRRDNRCSRPEGDWHHWKVYEVESDGEVKRSPEETKRAGWYDHTSIASLAKRTESYLSGEISEKEWEERPGIEPVWLDWFRELGIVTG